MGNCQPKDMTYWHDRYQKEGAILYIDGFWKEVSTKEYFDYADIKIKEDKMKWNKK
jgi:hypothetical protein